MCYTHRVIAVARFIGRFGTAQHLDIETVLVPRHHAQFNADAARYADAAKMWIAAREH